MSIIEGMEGNCVYMHVYINVCVCVYVFTEKGSYDF